MTGAADAAAPDGNVIHLLRTVSREHGDRPALVIRGRAVTFGTLVERIDRAAGGLVREGLRPGDRAVVLTPMAPELYVVLLALLQRERWWPRPPSSAGW